MALETTVIATGARPGDAAKRELFTEETQTVLVFEKGAVIRLSAAVADGQLLFLTNKKTGKEVVTQVIRKRSFRPTSCYVDLEFTEESPGFWGIEFSKTAAPSPGAPSASEKLAGEIVDSAASAPPGVQQVARLKREVAELQAQLQSLTTQPKSAEAGVSAATAAAPELSGELSGKEPAKEHHEEHALQQLLAQEAQQERFHGPQRLVAYPKKSTSSAVKKAGKIATVAAFAAVLASAGVAAYRFGLLNAWVGKAVETKPAPSHVAQPAAAPTTAAAKPVPNSATTLEASTNANTPSLGISAAASASPSMAAHVEPPPPIHIEPPATKRPVIAEDLGVPHGAKTGAAKIAPTRKSAIGSTALTSSDSRGNDSGSASSEVADDYVAPKLIYAVKPVSPPEALRNYVTGNVNVDALVDAGGHVKSVTVISGPAKLRDTAITEMKQYLYEPAKKNGKPVGSHVQVSLQFWYEP